MTAAERKKYLDLVRRHPLRPIRTEKELDRAIEIVDALLDRPALGKVERDYLDVLGSLVEAYEEARYPFPDIADDRMLRHLIEAQGTTQSKVALATGIADSTISAVLKGKRRLTREHIAKLAGCFQVDPAVFLFSESKRRDLSSSAG